MSSIVPSSPDPVQDFPGMEGATQYALHFKVLARLIGVCNKADAASDFFRREKCRKLSGILQDCTFLNTDYLLRPIMGLNHYQ